MMPDLRARINAAAQKPREKAAAGECMVLTDRAPLGTFSGLLEITPEPVRRLGLDHPGFDIRRCAFLDTETTGLRGAGTVAFLVGIGTIEGNEFIVRQYLMRDYPEEAHLLSEVVRLLTPYDTVVSFNGKSFDMPLLFDRLTLQRQHHRLRDLRQLDLLHAARRTWKLRLNSCTLSRLEEIELGIARENDLPGAEVPERFFRYLKTGDFSLLSDVLSHNLQDIKTLAVLLARLSGMYMAPEEQTNLLDVFSMGRALERCGESEVARRCFRVASVSALSQRARLEMAKSFRKQRDFQSAAETYREMILRGEGGPEACVALAILLERYMGDVRGALSVTESAIIRFSGGEWLHGAGEETMLALERRRARLKSRLAK